jgi:Txe/YoeB family toxin of Txe-Axe toxin-antitoxin module
VKVIKVECQNDKFTFIDKIKALAKETQGRVAQRVTFERRIVEVWEQNLSRDQEKQAWQDYINFEIA